MRSKNPLVSLAAAFAALFGCDDPADSLAAAERTALTQLIGDRLEDLAIFEEGEGDTVANVSYAQLRGGHVVGLSLQRMDLSTTAPLAALGQLERLNVSYNQLTALDGLSGIASLSELTASHNQLTNVTGLAGAGLTKLDLSENAIASASAVPPLDRLEVLNLSNNPLGSLEGLPPLVTLRELIAASCELSALTGLGAKPALERLTVPQNSLTTLAGLEGAPKLEVLFAERNQIRDASVLASLASLERADLRNNALTRPPTVSEGVQLEVEGNDFRIEDPNRWVVAGMDLGPPTIPYVESLPPPRGSTRNTHRSCRAQFTGVDCRETIGRLEGRYEVDLGGGFSSAPAGNLTLRVGSGKVRVYFPYPTNDVWTMREATPEAPLETGGTAVHARYDTTRLGGYVILIESVDGPAENVEVHFRTGFEP